jgi:DNA-binding IclR family transcriptional regulator
VQSTGSSRRGNLEHRTDRAACAFDNTVRLLLSSHILIGCSKFEHYRSRKSDVSKTVLKALRMLDLIAQADRPVTRRELTELAELDRSTASRLLATLESTGIVWCDPNTARYSVGIKVVSWAGAFLRGTDLRRLAAPLLRELRDDSGETATLHIVTGLDRVCIDGAESPEMIRRVVLLGERVPLYRGTTSKVILAHLDPTAVAQVMERAYADPTTSAELLGAHVAAARRNGYLSLSDDRVAGVASISAPIFEAAEVVGAFTVAGPSNRWSSDRREVFAETLVGIANRVSTSLGSAVPGAVDRGTLAQSV